MVDLHALTTGFEDVSRIHEDGIEMLADWIGAGVDPERSIVFRQSQVPEHAELALLLGMITPKSWLERVPTYKGQIAELGEQIDTYGFFGYPVLQTADIALYHATRVPVGQDQLPHLELAREIVRRFNHLYGEGEGEVLPEPQALLTEAPILLGIDNRKMSKSYGNAIELGAEPGHDPRHGRPDDHRPAEDPPRRPRPARDLQRVQLREALRHAGRAGRRDRPHVPHGRARLPRAQGRDRRADRRVPAPVPGAARGRRSPTAASSSGCSTAGAERAREIAVPNLQAAKEAMGL